MKTSEYVSKSYLDRIQINLANISASKNDEFRITRVMYFVKPTACELCHHEPCNYITYVENNSTHIEIKVGSECINHFKGKCDIDVAEGLWKRIRSTTRKMRRYAKKGMSNEEYKDLSKEQKRDLVTHLFMKYQTIEQLQGDSGKRTILKKDQVEKIVAESLNEITAA